MHADPRPLDPISADLVTLAFRIDRHFPGFIDAWFGPDEVKQAALAGEPIPPRDLAPEARRLMDDITRAGLDPNRQQALLAQVRAMETITRKLAGEEIPYRDEVRACFDIEPAAIPEAAFERAIADLDRILPGDGEVSARLAAWREASRLSPEGARAAIDLILAEVRDRTAAQVTLPPGEGVEVRFVADKPWSGYNWYLGGYRSAVDINTDLPIYAVNLVGLVAHEAYPGHHTEHALKDQLLYRERGLGEASIQLINTPECVIHEGIATLAEEMIFPGDDGVTWRRNVLYPRVGVDHDPARDREIGSALAALRGVAGNVALLRHAEGGSEADAISYLMRYGLNEEARARQRLRFIDDPLWRPYIFTYHVGYDLLGAWLAQAPDDAGRWDRFRQLLTQPSTPSMFRGDPAA